LRPWLLLARSRLFPRLLVRSLSLLPRLPGISALEGESLSTTALFCPFPPLSSPGRWAARVVPPELLLEDPPAVLGEVLVLLFLVCAM
jgi:hypothetical protein